MNLTNLPFEIKLNIVAMCRLLKKIFEHKPAPEPEINGKKYGLLFAINDYPGSQNDLNGCIQDMNDVSKFLNTYCPDMDYKIFRNEKATVSNFKAELKSFIDKLEMNDFLIFHYSGHGTQVVDKDSDDPDGYDEAMYLYDGPVIDDDIREILMSIPDNATVLLLFDCCFSGTITRDINTPKNRFKPINSERLRRNKKVRIPVENMKWLVFSGCGEHQTSADAFISGKYHGAFTYYLLQAYKPGMTYREWFEELRKHLPSKMYDQAPTLEGKKSLFDRKVFN